MSNLKFPQLVSFWQGAMPYPELEPFFNTEEDPAGAYEEITNTASEEGCMEDILDDYYLGSCIHPEAYEVSLVESYSDLRGFRNETPGPVFDEVAYRKSTYPMTGISVMAGLGFRMPTYSEILAKYQTFGNWALHQAEKTLSRGGHTAGVYFDGFGVDFVNTIHTKNMMWSSKGSLASEDHVPYGSHEIQTMRDQPWVLRSGSNKHWAALDFGDPAITVEERITTLHTVGDILRSENIQGPLTLDDCTFFFGETLANDLFHRSDGTPFGRWSGLPRVLSDHMYVLGDKEVEMLSKWHPVSDREA